MFLVCIFFLKYTQLLELIFNDLTVAIGQMVTLLDCILLYTGAVLVTRIYNN